MKELTEQEEQEMIDRAKGGDPQANYELSLWALERAGEEPDEVRWNKLAAKCLVKSAQAGYGPAQKRMRELLLEEKTGAPARTGKSEPGESLQTPSVASNRPATRRERVPSAPPIGGRTADSSPATASRPAPRRSASAGGNDDYEEPLRPARSPARPEAKSVGSSGKSRRGGKGKFFANWGDAQWRMMEIICVAVCIVLAIVLVVMLFSGRNQNDSTSEGSVPAADIAGEMTNTPAPAAYPDAATKAAIQAAGLDQLPDESDYVTAPLTATVSVSDNLRLRTGPNSTFDVMDQMPSGTRVEIFAKRSEWDLVRYNGSVWGWCSAEYLIEEASASAVPTATPEANGSATG